MPRYLVLLSFAACTLAAAAGEEAGFAVMDGNRDGFISESEFVSWQTRSGDVSPADALIRFIEIDADASGLISELELEAAMAGKSEQETDHGDTSEKPM